MKIELGVTPNGNLHCYRFPEDTQGEESEFPLSPAIAKAFEKGIGEGLFALAARRDAAELPSGLRFWGEFACIYMTARCNLSTSSAQTLRNIQFSLSPEIDRLLESAPPMKGAEYLSREVFEGAWTAIDSWLCDAVNRTGGGLAGFLRKRAPLWHQVGRVCFHLAENKRDEDYPFAFMATYTAGLSDGGEMRHKPLGEALRQYAGDKRKEELINLLSPVHLASESSSLIKDLLESGDIYYPLAWTPSDACKFIRDLPLYEKAGLSIRLPDWWKKRSRPQVTVRIDSSEERKFTAKSLLDFNISLTLGGHPLTEEEWRELAASGEGLVLFKGQWVEVDGEKLNEALEHWKKVERSVARDGISFVEGMRLLAGSPADLSASGKSEAEKEWSSVRAGEGLRGVLEGLRNPGTQALELVGGDLNATLRPYQKKGLGWLWHLSRLKLGACLADDMGLGKTIQVIALLVALKKQGGETPSLLVLPASLLSNWKSELERFAPSIDCLFVHPSFSPQNGAKTPGQEDDSFSGVDLVITTYGMLSRNEWLLERQWRIAVIDEAQAIKNPATRQTRAVKRIKAESRIALTGTPVENRLTDLWSLFDFLCPGLLGSVKRFHAFVKSLDGDDHYAPLRNLVRPYILRRLKTDKTIIADLPDKTEVYAYCGLSRKQAALYEKSVHELKAALSAEEEGIKRRGLVLSFITRFKQICNHPSQWLGDGSYRPADSGKFSRLSEICEEIASRQEKALVFTQFREMTGHIEEFLAGCFGRGGLVLHGATPVARRRKLVDQFQREDGPPFFVLSIRAGGVGLNLTQASHVIHFDRWWNPAVENQATDRAFRIGQKRNVLVHKMVCEGTIEDKIDRMMTEKSALSDDILKGGGERLLTEMSDDKLIEIVSLDVGKVIG